ncbi:hypothetical protein LCGC14_2693630 [marine sediment metagenome]|uniref:Uncharacterized protein n=1 Tax=marine sediment metagenome TaxID=412755 RepID=A0A0F8ZHU9_9ZZZZ
MKSGIELVKELRKEEAGSYINASRAAGIGYATAKLEAWLREVDEWVRKDRASWQPSQTWGVGPVVEDIRRELLGTMRPISKNGE